MKKILPLCLLFTLLVVKSLNAKTSKNIIILNSIGVPIVTTHAEILKNYLVEISDNIEVFDGKGDSKLLKTYLERRLANRKPDLVVANATLASKVAKEVLKDSGVPMIFMTVSDPVGSGLVDELGNESRSFYTGVAYAVSRTTKVQLVSRIFKNKHLKIGMVASTYPSAVGDISLLKVAAKEMKNIEFVASTLPYVGKGEKSFDKLMDESIKKAKTIAGSVDYFWEVYGPLAETEIFSKSLIKLKPVIYGLNPNSVKSGALFCMIPDSRLMIKEVFEIIESILSGHKPGKIPIKSPKKSVLTVNLKTANSLGLVLPFDVLQLAGDNVIK